MEIVPHLSLSNVINQRRNVLHPYLPKFEPKHPENSCFLGKFDEMGLGPYIGVVATTRAVAHAATAFTNVFNLARGLLTMATSTDKKAKRRLQDLEPRELREAYREMKAKRDDLQTRVNVLEESERALRTELNAVNDVYDRLQNAYNELTEQFQQAQDNNTSLRALIESTPAGEDDISDSIGAQLIARMDIIIGLIGGDPPVGEDSIDDERGDDFDDIMEVMLRREPEPLLHFPHGQQAAPVPTNLDNPDEDGDEDDSAEDDSDEDDSEEDDSNEYAEPAPVHGIDAQVAGEARAYPVTNEHAADQDSGDRVAGVTEDELTSLIAPEVKKVVDAFKDYEDIILAPVRDGSMTKELALRTIVTQAYPAHPDMPDAVLNAPTTREAVYEMMGL